MSRNGFSHNLANKLIKSFTPRTVTHNNTTHVDQADSTTPDNLPKIWIRLPFIGNYGNTLTKKFMSKTRRLLKKFKVYFELANHKLELFPVMQRQDAGRI
jgi:hypothetical protein